MVNELEVSQYFGVVERGGFSESWQCEVNLLGRAADSDQQVARAGRLAAEACGK